MSGKAGWKRAVTLGVGSVALGTTALYIAGAAAVFLGLSPTWTQLFLGHFLWMLYVPMCLLLVHLWARVQVGQWLLEAGDLEGVLAWTKGRVRPNFWLRGKREALCHRLHRAQAYVRLVEYESAAALLWEEGVSWPGGKEMTRLARWRVEVGLRVDDLVRAREAFEAWERWGIKRDGRERAWLLGARAEVDVRMGDRGMASERLRQARWEGEDSWRLRVTEFLGEVSVGREAALGAQDLACVQEVLPGMAMEVCVRAGCEVEARMREQADARSIWVSGQVDQKERS